jgi:peptidoglycan/LPS O-acetylase OafA/YrhL
MQSGVGGSGRVGALDSLRGIAALIVVLTHVLLTYGWNVRLDHPGVRLLLSGDGAVILFFALSGLVLARTYVGRDDGYIPYAVKRVIRIYLPFAAAVLVAAALDRLIGQAPIAGASAWFNDAGWHSPVTAHLIFSHLVMSDTNELDNAIWSLFHELRISLVLPILAVAILTEWRAVLTITLGLAAMTLMVLAKTSHDPVIANYLTSMEYLPVFAIGAVIGLRGTPAVRMLEGAGGFWQIMLLLLALVALTHTPPSTVPIVGTRPVVHLLLCGSASAILLVFALADTPVTRLVLNHPIAQYLGWISYSLYLVHLIVLEVLVRLMAGHAPHFVPVLLTLPVSLALAHLMRVTVEEWAQHLGRAAAAALSGGKKAPASGFGAAQ